jgi:hypothetical protein
MLNRLWDKYALPIVSLAILGDDRETWLPQSFERELWGCEVSFRFPIIKLLDYIPRWAELEASHNPFAIAVMAHLKTKETRNDAVARKEWKFRLTRSLYERGYERQDILNIFRFLDWMLELPEDLKRSFRDELAQYERERQMPYVTSIAVADGKPFERMGIEQGIEIERQAIALKMLREGIPLETISRITELTIDRLQQLQALSAQD